MSNASRRPFIAVPVAPLAIEQPDIIDLLSRVTVKTIEGDQDVVIRDGHVIARSFDVPMRYDVACPGHPPLFDVVRAQLRVTAPPTETDRNRLVLPDDRPPAQRSVS